MNNTYTLYNGSIKFENVERFDAWLKKNANYEYDLEHELEDVLTSHSTNGAESYELASHLTKSGNPELYLYTYEYIWDEENEEAIEETFIF